MFHNMRKIPVNLIHNSQFLNFVIRRNAGHSKWANIRHIKGLKDLQKSQLFTKLGRQIRVAIQEGGGSIDPKRNLKLEQIIEQAKRLSMPVATIESIIKSTQTNKEKCKSYLIEIKGPGNCMIICEVFTEHFHALKQTLATILRKHSSKFSDGGGGLHFFHQKGIIITEPLKENKSQEEILEIATEHAIECGAEDVTVLEEGELEFSCSSSAFNKVQAALVELNYKLKSASLEYVPNKLQALCDADLEVCSSLFEKLESHPDVVKLYDNIG